MYFSSFSQIGRIFFFFNIYLRELLLGLVVSRAEISAEPQKMGCVCCLANAAGQHPQVPLYLGMLNALLSFKIVPLLKYVLGRRISAFE